MKNGGTLSLVVACARNRAIGLKNQLPWRLPDDLKRFKELTTGAPVIMGRKTFESIGRPLPNRRNLVITRQVDFSSAGIETAASLEAAIELCSGTEQVFVIGGAEIYRLALPHADRIYLTWVESEVEGDAFFPEGRSEEFDLVSRKEHPADDRHSVPFSFQTLILN